MTYPVGIERPKPDPKPEPVTASVLSANLVLMNQMAETEVWVSSDEED